MVKSKGIAGKMYRHLLFYPKTGNVSFRQDINTQTSQTPINSQIWPS